MVSAARSDLTKALTIETLRMWRGKLQKQASEIKVLAANRQAGHNYLLLDRYEAGIVLTGTEVKATREGKVQLKDAYGEVHNGEAWLVNAHISPYSHGNRMNHEPVRRRKLLLHRTEIDKLQGKTRERGFTLIPTKIYLKTGRIKCELALARAKRLYDKREAERARTTEAEARQALRQRQ
jgi:SsrA-binding protein